MALTPEEEKKYREEIRKNLAGKEEKEEERKRIASDEKRILLEKRLRQKIKEEEEDKFYTDRGYVKYTNRHGEIEWLFPEELEKRKSSKRSRKGSSGSRRRKRKLNLFLNFIILFGTIGIFAVLYKMNLGSAPKTGSISVTTDLPGAIIYIDAEKLDNLTPDTLLNVNEGRHFISVYKEGYSTNPPLQRVHVVQGKTVSADFVLENVKSVVDVALKVNISGYQLYVDGLPAVMEKGAYVKVTTGYHTFMVIKKGYTGNPSFQRILVPEVGTTVVSFEMIPDSQIGYIRVSNNMFAGYIYIDDQCTGLQARGDLLPVKSGTHEIQVKANGFVCRPDSHLINILPGEQEAFIFRMEPEEKSYQINIRTTEPGASIFLDGIWTPYVTPVTNLPVSPGKHYLNLVKDSRSFSEKDQKIAVNYRSNKDFYYNFNKSGN